MKEESEAEELGKARQAAHPHGTPRLYDDPNTEDIMGVTGELAFAKRYNLEIDREIKPEGDGHVDFWVTVGDRRVSIDVKANRNPYNLLIKSWEIDVMSDIGVLARYKEEDGIVGIEFLGWETREIMRMMPVKAWPPLDTDCYYRHVSQLRPMFQLDNLLGVSDFL